MPTAHHGAAPAAPLFAATPTQVEEVLLPRTNELVDPSVANVDFALLVFALTQPPVSACPASC